MSGDVHLDDKTVKDLITIKFGYIWRKEPAFRVRCIENWGGWQSSVSWLGGSSKGVCLIIIY